MKRSFAALVVLLLSACGPPPDSYQPEIWVDTPDADVENPAAEKRNKLIRKMRDERNERLRKVRRNAR